MDDNKSENERDENVHEGAAVEADSNKNEAPTKESPAPDQDKSENVFEEDNEDIQEGANKPGKTKSASDLEVEWRASEYVHHEKGPMWFMVLAGITVVGVVLALIFQQWTFAFLIIVMGVAVGFFASRPPQEIHYQIGRDGITVGPKTFSYSQFRAFGITTEGAFYVARLRPTKRFMPGVSLIFAEEHGEKIFDSLAARLPSEEIHPDPIEQFMRWLRF